METQMDHIKADWDYFIILDAVRYDYFEKLNPIKGRLKKIYGIASHTRQFYKNLPLMKDVVCVCAAPYGANYVNKFKEMKSLFLSHWNNDWGVSPASVVKESLREIWKNPNQRLFIHFLQPHFPFIGFPSMAWGMDESKGSPKSRSQLRPNHDIIEKMCRKGDDHYKACYSANLAMGLGGVARLLPYMKGKIFVTTDHGTMFGHRGGQCGHNPSDECDDLRHIPLLEIYRDECIDMSGIDVETWRMLGLGDIND